MLTPADIATDLRVTRRTAQRWMRAGALPAMLLPSGDYRVDPAEYERWKAERHEIARLVSPNGLKQRKTQLERPAGPR